MKKNIIFYSIFFLGVSVFSHNFSIQELECYVCLLSRIDSLRLENNTIAYIMEPYEYNKENEKVVSYKEIHQDGLLFFKLSEILPEIIDEQKTSPSNTMLILAGKIIREDKTNLFYPDGKILFFGETAGFEAIKWCFITPTMKFDDHSGRRYIDVSSYLKEKNKEYKVENLCNCKPGTPWVEGVSGDGIGEGFTIYRSGVKDKNPFENNSLYLLIMNGYISYEKPYLYKQNNRIKKIKVTGVKSGKSKILDVLDTPHPQTVDISFITEPEDVRVEIAEVYKGTKYDDTCINFCITYTDKVIPYEDSIQ